MPRSRSGLVVRRSTDALTKASLRSWPFCVKVSSAAGWAGWLVWFEVRSSRRQPKQLEQSRMPTPEYWSRQTACSSGLLRSSWSRRCCSASIARHRPPKARFARSISDVRDRPAVPVRAAEPGGVRRHNRAEARSIRQQHCDDRSYRALTARMCATGCSAAPRSRAKDGEPIRSPQLRPGPFGRAW